MSRKVISIACPDGQTDIQTDRQTDDIMMTIPFGKICRGVKRNFNNIVQLDEREFFYKCHFVLWT